MVIDLKATGIVEAEKLTLNIRTWLRDELSALLTEQSAIRIIEKSRANVISRTKKRTGELIGSHDRALMNMAKSAKGQSTTIIIDAINTRGQSYAGAVEFGAQNPLTGGFNTPKYFFRDAVNEFITQELEGLSVKALSKMPKK